MHSPVFIKEHDVSTLFLNNSEKIIINRQVCSYNDKANGTECKQLVNRGRGCLGVPSAILVTFL